MPIKNFACDIHDIQKQLEFHIYPSIDPPFIACDTINMITAQRLLYAIALQIKNGKAETASPFSGNILFLFQIFRKFIYYPHKNSYPLSNRKKDKKHEK